MRLYIGQCHICSNKINLTNVASTRQQLRNVYSDYLKVKCHHCYGTSDYLMTEVYAESDINPIVGGGVVGALVGLLGGPIGLIIGASSGVAIGAAKMTEDQRNVNQFNQSP